MVLYNSLIFDRASADLHPDWRMRAVDGSPARQGGPARAGLPEFPLSRVCPRLGRGGMPAVRPRGVPVRHDLLAGRLLLRRIARSGSPTRSAARSPPRSTGSTSGGWPSSIVARRWLAEFAADRHRHGAEHCGPGPASSISRRPIPLHWQFGVNAPLIPQNDFLQGDFYGDSWQGSFVRKLLEDLTPHRPFGFETSFSAELADHTAMKSEALLEAKASAAVADNAAFIFIDAIDPIGTLNPKVYDRMGRIFDRLMPYYAELGGKRVADVAVYYSLDSKFDFAGNGRPVPGADTTDAHTKSVTAVTRGLGSHHIPFGFITRTTLAHLNEHKVLILPNVNMMDDAEIEAIRDWVRRGGCLIATGWTSLVDTHGRLRKDFGLGDVFGVALKSPSWTAWPHYIAPKGEGEALFGDFSPAYPAFARTTGQEVVARPGSDVAVLATTTLVWPTADSTRFASIHSNPPWQPTDRPEVVLNRFGKGRAIYCASPMETVESLGSTIARLVRRLRRSVQPSRPMRRRPSS